MRGRIIKIENNKFYLITENGEFVDADATDGFECGDEVEIKKDMPSYIKPLASMAAAVVIMLGGVRAYHIPVRYVDLCINPEIQLALNVLDRVIAVEGKNSDGEKIVSSDGLSSGLKNETVDDAIGEIVDTARSFGYMENGEDGERDVIVSVYGSNAEKLSKKITMENVRVVGKSDCENAQRANIPVGKYVLMKELESVDVQSKENTAQMSVKQLIDKIDEVKKRPAATPVPTKKPVPTVTPTSAPVATAEPTTAPAEKPAPTSATKSTQKPTAVSASKKSTAKSTKSNTAKQAAVTAKKTTASTAKSAAVTNKFTLTAPSAKKDGDIADTVQIGATAAPTAKPISQQSGKINRPTANQSVQATENNRDNSPNSAQVPTNDMQSNPQREPLPNNESVQNTQTPFAPHRDMMRENRDTDGNPSGEVKSEPTMNQGTALPKNDGAQNEENPNTGDMREDYSAQPKTEIYSVPEKASDKSDEKQPSAPEKNSYTSGAGTNPPRPNADPAAEGGFSPERANPRENTPQSSEKNPQQPTVPTAPVGGNRDGGKDWR